jgi:hypothetical protein
MKTINKSGYDIYVKEQKEIENEIDNENKDDYYNNTYNENENEIDYNFNDEYQCRGEKDFAALYQM